MIDLGKVEKLMALMAQYGVDVVQAETGPEKFRLQKMPALCRHCLEWGKLRDSRIPAAFRQTRQLFSNQQLRPQLQQ